MIVLETDKALYPGLSPEFGWTMPVDTNAYRLVQLRTDVNLSGIHTLSLAGDNAFRVWQSPYPSTTNAPLLVSGQTVTNGVNGISWGTSDAASLYLQTLTNGTTTLTYSFIGTGSASGIVCRATMKMTGVYIKFDSMYDTFNPANRVFNPTPKDDPPTIPTNKLYLVESPDLRCYQAGLKISCYPCALLNRIIAAVYYDGDKLDSTDSQFLPDGTTMLVFADTKLGIEPTDYEVKVGLDSNGNYLLDESEIISGFSVRNPETGTSAGQPIIRGSDVDKYDDALFTLTAGSVDYPFNQVPHAAALLRIFVEGDLLGLANDKKPAGSSSIGMDAFNGYFSEWLTHNAGAPFNAAGVANIQEYRWDATNSLGILVAESPQMENAVTEYYENTIFHIVTNAFESMPVGTVLYFPESTEGTDVPHTSLSPDWVSDCTVEFSDGNLQPSLINDLFSTIARARIKTHKVRYTVEKQHSILWGDRLVVTGVQSWGEIEDLYDFNHEAGMLSQWGATVQLGYGNGHYTAYRTGGKIYRTRVIFNKTYEELP